MVKCKLPLVAVAAVSSVFYRVVQATPLYTFCTFSTFNYCATIMFRFKYLSWNNNASFRTVEHHQEDIPTVPRVPCVRRDELWPRVQERFARPDGNDRVPPCVVGPSVRNTSNWLSAIFMYGKNCSRYCNVGQVCPAGFWCEDETQRESVGIISGPTPFIYGQETRSFFITTKFVYNTETGRSK